MSTLFEQSISQNTRCFTCGSLVYAVEKKITTKHVYHNRCFRCRICKRNLTGYSLNEEGDDIYCANCYRRKQRGDCDSFEFHRAAAEKAQFVHNREKANQQQSSVNSRSSSFREAPRFPSLTLRHLERQFLGLHHQPSTNNENNNNNNENNNTSIRNKNNYNNESTDGIIQKPVSKYQPLTINTNFSTPIHLTGSQHDSLSIKDEPTPQFTHIFSPISTRRTETIITPHLASKTDEICCTDKQPKSATLPMNNASYGIEFRLNKSNLDLTNDESTRSRQKSIVIPDLNQTHEQKERKILFPEFSFKSIPRRSSSAHPYTHLSPIN